MAALANSDALLSMATPYKAAVQLVLVGGLVVPGAVRSCIAWYVYIIYIYAHT